MKEKGPFIFHEQKNSGKWRQSQMMMSSLLISWNKVWFEKKYCDFRDIHLWLLKPFILCGTQIYHLSKCIGCFFFIYPCYLFIFPLFKENVMLLNLKKKKINGNFGYSVSPKDSSEVICLLPIEKIVIVIMWKVKNLIT